MLNAPKVSIVVAAFNAANFVAETIESMIAQTHPHWEAIFVDDHSTDGTAAIIKQYASQDSRVRYVLAPSHAGRPSTNRTIGIQLAQGEFITFMDADDSYLPKALELLLKPLLSDSKMNASMAFPYYCDSRLTPLHPSPHLEEPQKGQYRFAPGYSLDWENLCKRTLYLFVCSVMFRASVLKQLPPMDETLLTGDDFKLLVSLFCKGFDKVSLLPECTYLYRNYAGSITKNPTRLMKVSESHIALTEWFFSLPEMPANLQRLKGYHLSHRLAVLTSTLTKMNRPDLSVQMIAKSLKFRFISPVTWFSFFGKEIVRLCMPTQLRQLTSQLLRRQAADYFGQRTEGQSALPTATAALP